MDTALSHAALMDATYRHQRRVYDLSRRYFLLGRDHLIARLAPPPGGSILEIACGTGRNLDHIGRAHPGCRLFGLDISEQMLRSARGKLGPRAHLARADACRFDPAALFGTARFDRIVLSYSLSMIPDWEVALTEAARHLAEGGALHVVDFGSQSELPEWFRTGLRLWLGRFHVVPRDDFPGAFCRLARESGGTVRFGEIHRSYARYGVFSPRSVPLAESA